MEIICYPSPGSLFWWKIFASVHLKVEYVFLIDRSNFIKWKKIYQYIYRK